MSRTYYQLLTHRALKILACALSLWVLLGCNADAFGPRIPGVTPHCVLYRGPAMIEVKDECNEDLDDESEEDDIAFTASPFATET